MVYVLKLWTHLGVYVLTFWIHLWIRLGGLHLNIVDSFGLSISYHFGFIWVVYVITLWSIWVVYILTLWIRLGGVRLNIVDLFGWCTS